MWGILSFGIFINRLRSTFYLSIREIRYYKNRITYNEIQKRIFLKILRKFHTTFYTQSKSTNNNIALTLLQQDICRCLPAARHLVDRVVRLVHGHEEHGEAKLEEHEDGEELAEVNHEAADDDGPRAEQVVEGEKVQNLREK